MYKRTHWSVVLFFFGGGRGELIVSNLDTILGQTCSASFITLGERLAPLHDQFVRLSSELNHLRDQQQVGSAITNNGTTKYDHVESEAFVLVNSEIPSTLRCSVRNPVTVLYWYPVQ